MKNIKFLKLKSFAILLSGLLAFTACDDNEDFGLDADKVVPTIFDFAGTDLVNVMDVVEFSVTPRAGSTFVWEATNAEISAVSGTTSKVNVAFNSVGTSTVSVYEKTANGSVSEAMTQSVNVLLLCDWTLVMLDAYADGWNGASIDISFTGAATIAPVNLTLDDGGSGQSTFSAPSGYDMSVTFNSGDWDGEITYGIYDGSGTLVFSDSAYPATGEVYTTTVTCP